MIATIDFETTGLKTGEDEVLQVSIIDENYNVLLNAYCRPNNKESWEDAQAVHGITPLMVANELPFERYVPTVLDILSRADYVIAYNYAFEDRFLRAYGIEVSREKWFDPMLTFADIYGDKPLLPANVVVLLSTEANYSMYYGAVGVTDEAGKTIEVVEGSRIPEQWVERRPPRRFLQLNSAPLCVPHEVDSWYVATVC